MVKRNPATESEKKPKCFGAFDDGEGTCDRCHNDVAPACKSKTHDDMLEQVAKSASRKAPRKTSEPKTKKKTPRKKAKKKTPKKASKKSSKRKRR